MEYLRDLYNGLKSILILITAPQRMLRRRLLVQKAGCDQEPRLAFHKAAGEGLADGHA